MKAIRSILAILTITLAVACSDTRLSPKEYMEAIGAEDSGYLMRREIAGYAFEAIYTPIDLLALREHGESITKEELNLKRKGLENTAQFILRIKFANQAGDFIKFGVTSKEGYADRVSYFSYSFQQDIYLEQDGKKLPCEMYHFERNYGIKPDRSFTIGFTGVDTNKAFKLVIDSPMLDTGPVKMNFTNPGILSLSI